MTPYISKLLLVFIILISYTSLIAQANKKPLKTSILSGIYQYGSNIEKGPIGSVTVFSESDTTVLFFVDVNRGTPSYNMGQLYGRMKVKNYKGIYSKTDSLGISCKFECEFKGDKLIITVFDNQDECGFGYGVYPDGTYKRKTHKIPLYFIDATETKVYFKKIKPEDWNKE